MSSAELLRLIASASLAVHGGAHNAPKSPIYQISPPPPVEWARETCEPNNIRMQLKKEWTFWGYEQYTGIISAIDNTREIPNLDTLAGRLGVTIGNQGVVEQYVSDLQQHGEARIGFSLPEKDPNINVGETVNSLGFTIDKTVWATCTDGSKPFVDSAAVRAAEAAKRAAEAAADQPRLSINDFKDDVANLDQATPDWVKIALWSTIGATALGLIGFVLLATRDSRSNKEEYVKEEKVAVTTEEPPIPKDEGTNPPTPPKAEWEVKKERIEAAQARYNTRQEVVDPNSYDAMKERLNQQEAAEILEREARARLLGADSMQFEETKFSE